MFCILVQTCFQRILYFFFILNCLSLCSLTTILRRQKMKFCFKDLIICPCHSDFWYFIPLLWIFDWKIAVDGIKSSIYKFIYRVVIYLFIIILFVFGVVCLSVFNFGSICFTPEASKLTFCIYPKLKSICQCMNCPRSFFTKQLLIDIRCSLCPYTKHFYIGI